MQNINTYINNQLIIEKLKISSKSTFEIVNDVNMSTLNSFTKEDVNEIITWINTDFPENIRPIIITNEIYPENVNTPGCELYCLYDEDYKHKTIYSLPYIRFWNSQSDGLSVDIYDPEEKAYYNSDTWYKNKKLTKCFDYIIKRKNTLKKILKIDV